LKASLRTRLLEHLQPNGARFLNWPLRVDPASHDSLSSAAFDALSEVVVHTNQEERSKTYRWWE
ncbi:hypothetical protein, partial [Caballeronia sp. RCC_10]|uniref:hypothetical protein n=1 Tax=Caballeronia sp. RCC_10 TaxID=3239227 RepID=UPI003523C02D